MTLRLFVVRHGETEWSKIGQHTGLTDLSLTEAGRQEASATRAVLDGCRFDAVYSSPLKRALETAELAGYGDAEIEPLLVEWDYGDHEGRRTADIVNETPGFSKWDTQPPNGESVEQVGERADQVIARLTAATPDETSHNVALFAHGHFLAVLIARWIGLPADQGRRFRVHTGTVSVLDQYRDDRIVAILNQTPDGQKSL